MSVANVGMLPRVNTNSQLENGKSRFNPEERNRKMKRLLVCMAAMGIAAMLSAEAAEAVLDRMCEGVSRYWQVAFTNEVRVPWAACPSATSATLKTIGMDGEATTTITRSGEELETAHFLAVPNGEDVCTLELTYLGAGGAALETVTGTVAFVKSAACGASVDGISVDASETKPWNRTARPGTADERIVLGYDADWIDGETEAKVTLSQQKGGKVFTSETGDGGWIAWNLRGDGWGYGWFDVSFVGVDGGSLAASVWRPNEAMVILFK